MEEKINELAIPQSDDEKALKSAVTCQAMSVQFAPISTDIQVDTRQATRLPLTEITNLGTAFSELSQVLQSSSQPITELGKGVVQLTDKVGNPVDLSILNVAKDGSGALGSFMNAEGKLSQVRIHEAVIDVKDAAAGLPYDPTTLFMAAALAEINKKLDEIQETQKEMFEYIRNKDKADLRGSLDTLSDVLNNYRYFWNNEQYKNNKHILVQSIRNDANSAIIQHRAEIKGRLGKRGFFHLNQDVSSVIDVVRSEFEEYRLAVYLYAFSSFLEVMLLENYDGDYLAGTAEKIERFALDYRMLYTEAFNSIENDSETSVESTLLGGISGISGFLGKAIAKTPIGERTQVDEFFQDASANLIGFKKGLSSDMLSKLVEASTSDVRPFIENIESVDRLYNEPYLLLGDADSVYVVPIERQLPYGEDE